MFDRQKAFNTAYKGIVAQGKQAISGGTCRYRFRGLKCAVGQLIPDDKYDRKFDKVEGGLTPDQNTPLAAKLRAAIGATEADAEFLSDLQRAHDFVMPTSGQPFVDEFKRRAAEVAKTYQLEVPEL